MGTLGRPDPCTQDVQARKGERGALQVAAQYVLLITHSIDISRMRMR